MYQSKTGIKCTCKPGIQRDNCPACEAIRRLKQTLSEGTGEKIDSNLIRQIAKKHMEQRHAEKGA